MNSPSDCWDRSRALEGIAGDDKFLRELATIFSATCPTLLKGLEDSMTAENLPSLVETSRLLGRVGACFAADRVSEAALVLEITARRNDLVEIDNACHSLRHEVGRLREALADSQRASSLPSGTLRQPKS